MEGIGCYNLPVHVALLACLVRTKCSIKQETLNISSVSALSLNTDVPAILARLDFRVLVFASQVINMQENTSECSFMILRWRRKIPLLPLPPRQ